MSTRKRQLPIDTKVKDEDVKATPRAMLMKLRSYPDTAEVKKREVGMYKSPAPFKKSVTSRRKLSVKTPVKAVKGSTKSTPATVIRNVNELKRATMELNEVTPQYPPAHYPVMTPKSKRLSTSEPAENENLNKATPHTATQPDSASKKKRSFSESTVQAVDTLSNSKSQSPITSTSKRRKSYSTSDISITNKTKSSLRSSAKGRDTLSSRRVSFGPVHEYHPEDYVNEEKVGESDNEEVIPDDDFINDDSLVPSDQSLAFEEDLNEIAIPSFKKRKPSKQSPLLQTPPLLRPPPLMLTKDHRAKTTKNMKKTIPVSFTKKLFSLYAKKRMTKEAAEVLVESADDFIEYVSKELEVYAHHAKRRTIDMSDVILFLKREKYLTGSETFSSLANKYMCDEHVSEIVPCIKVLCKKP